MGYSVSVCGVDFIAGLSLAIWATLFQYVE